MMSSSMDNAHNRCGNAIKPKMRGSDDGIGIQVPTGALRVNRGYIGYFGYSANITAHLPLKALGYIRLRVVTRYGTGRSGSKP